MWGKGGTLVLDSIMDSFIKKAYELLENYEKKGRYYHTLTPQDNSPIVVHKRTNQLTYVIEGDGTVVVNGQVKDIHKGMTIFVEAGNTHQFTAKSDSLVLFHIHIPDEGRETDRFIIEGDDYNRYE